MLAKPKPAAHLTVPALPPEWESRFREKCLAQARSCSRAPQFIYRTTQFVNAPWSLMAARIDELLARGADPADVHAYIDEFHAYVAFRAPTADGREVARVLPQLHKEMGEASAATVAALTSSDPAAQMNAAREMRDMLPLVTKLVDLFSHRSTHRGSGRAVWLVEPR